MLHRKHNPPGRWVRQVAWLLIAALLASFVPTVCLPTETAHAAIRLSAARRAGSLSAAPALPPCCCPPGQCHMPQCSHIPPASPSAKGKTRQIACRADCGTPVGPVIEASFLFLRALPPDALSPLLLADMPMLPRAAGERPLATRALTPPHQPPRVR